MGLRWLLIGGANLGLLAIANTARIITLVVLTHVLHQPDLAQIMHVPLGLMGFVVASLMTWGLLHWVPHQGSVAASKDVRTERKQARRTLTKTAFIIASILALTLIPHPQGTTASTVDLSKLQWSTLIQTQAIGLNPYEQKFFADYPGVTTQKQRFQFQDLTGSIVLVASPTWQAHHAPELCLTAFGYHH